MRVVVDPTTVIPLPGALTELTTLVANTSTAAPGTERYRIYKWLDWANSILNGTD